MSEANLGIINISMDIEQLRDYCLSLPHSSESMPFGDGCIVYKVVDRIFVSIHEGIDTFFLPFLRSFIFSIIVV